MSTGSETAAILRENSAAVRLPTRERLFYGGFGVLLTIALFFPLEEKVQARMVNFFGELPRGVAVINLLLIVGLIGLCVVPLKRGTPDARDRNVKIAIIGLVFFSLVSFVTTEVYTSFAHFSEDLFSWKAWNTTLLLYVFARRFIHSRAQIKALLHGMTAVLAFASLQLLRENFDAGMSATGFKDNLRFAGLFSGAGINDMGAFFAEFLFLPLCLFALEKGAVKRAYLAAVAVLTVVACLFTYSRGAWLGMIAGLIVYAFRRRVAAVVIVLVLALAIIPILPASVVDRWKMTEDSNGQLESSAQIRIDLWKTAQSMIAENPLLGVGMNRFHTLVEQHLEPHDTYLKVATEQGIPALLCFLFFLGASCWAIQGPVDRFEREVFLSVMGCWSALIVVNIFGNRFMREGLISNYLILLGVVSWLRTHRDETQNSTSATPAK